MADSSLDDAARDDVESLLEIIEAEGWSVESYSAGAETVLYNSSGRKETTAIVASVELSKDV